MKGLTDGVDTLISKLLVMLLVYKDPTKALDEIYKPPSVTSVTFTNTQKFLKIMLMKK